MYNIEIYNRTAGRVVASQPATTEVEASKTAVAFISRIKESCKVVRESEYDLSPRCRVFGQTLYTADEIYVVSTARG